jgi:hypothetical protein
VDPYIHSPIRLHGVVLNSLSKGTALLYNVRCIQNIRKGEGRKEHVGDIGVDGRYYWTKIKGCELAQGMLE